MFDNDTFFIALSENQSNVFVRRWTIQASSSVFCLPTYALRSCTVRSGCVLRRTVRPKYTNLPKIRFKKFVKLTDHTCACNDLTNFECEKVFRSLSVIWCNVYLLAKFSVKSPRSVLNFHHLTIYFSTLWIYWTLLEDWQILKRSWWIQILWQK